MAQQNWKTFSVWEGIVAKSGRSLESPFNQIPLTQDSLYFWNQMSAPLPSGSTYGAWGIFPDPAALAGFLRYIVLPTFFEIWLNREEWDKDPEAFIKAEELFERAEKSGKCGYLEDLPLMRSLIESLDALMVKNNEDVRTGLVDVAEKFNNRWQETPTWCFKIEIYEDPVAVGKEVLGRVVEDLDEDSVIDEFGMSEEDWMKICKNVLIDEHAKTQYIETLSNQGIF